jgi:hypothetical protein
MCNNQFCLYFWLLHDYIHKISLWNKKKDWILKSKFEYGIRYFHLSYLNCWPFRKWGFLLHFTSLRDLIQRSNIRNWYSEWFWNINMFMNPGISNWYFWNIYSTKMRVLLLFRLATRILTSKHPKLFRT